LGQTNNNQPPDDSELKYAFSVTVRVLLDEKNSIYKTESTLDSALEEDDVPRDLILAIVHELTTMRDLIVERADISNEEIRDFIAARKLLRTSEEVLDSSIDKVIDSLFPEDKQDKDDENRL